MKLPWGFAAAMTAVIAALATGLVPLLWLGATTGVAYFDPYVWRVSLLTLFQALVSTMLSVGMAVPVARALARQRFHGRGLLLTLFSLPQALPAIVVVMGLVGIYGMGGVLEGWIALFSLEGVIVAHVFFNLALATRLLVTRLDSIPADYFRLAASLGFSGAQMFRRIEWPHLRHSLFGITGLVFLLCTASFAIVVILANDPQHTTLQVAIYQALRLDFDPARAAVLSLVQVGLCFVLVLAGGRYIRHTPIVLPRVKAAPRFDGHSIWARTADGLFILLAMAIILPPMLVIILSGLFKIQMNSLILHATFTSFMVAVLASGIGLALTFVMAAHATRGSGPVRSLLGILVLVPLILPPAVVATGWFLLVYRFIDSPYFSLGLIVALNALMCIPFMWTILQPEIAESYQRNNRLCEALGLSGFNRLRLVELPVLWRVLRLAFLTGMLVSLGDLSAIAIFGSTGLVTLPTLILQQMGHYRMGDAEGTALLLALFCVALAALAQRNFKHDHA